MFLIRGIQWKKISIISRLWITRDISPPAPLGTRTQGNWTLKVSCHHWFSNDMRNTCTSIVCRRTESSGTRTTGNGGFRFRPMSRVCGDISLPSGKDTARAKSKKRMFAPWFSTAWVFYTNFWRKGHNMTTDIRLKKDGTQDKRQPKRSFSNTLF